jgi:hypothetical protein
MPKHKSPISIGLERLLNDNRTSPFTAEGSKGFKAVLSASQLPVSEALKHIGKRSKGSKVPKKTEKEISEERTSALEAETEAAE